MPPLFLFVLPDAAFEALGRVWSLLVAKSRFSAGGYAFTLLEQPPYDALPRAHDGVGGIGE